MVQILAAEYSLIAISWAMPPVVLPRAIQVARTLKGLHRQNWHCDVIAATPTSVRGVPRDDRLGIEYDPFYDRHLIDPTETAHVDGLARCIGGLVKQEPLQEWESRWKAKCRRKAVSLAKSSHADALLTFAQPWVDHLAGLEIKQLRPNLPWIAHFSDPWVDNPFSDDITKDLMAYWQTAEQQVVENADALVFVSDRCADLVMSKYDQRLGKKSFVIPHMADPDVLKHLDTPESSDECLKIVISGGVYVGQRDPLFFLKALSELNTLEKLEGRLRLEIIGGSKRQLIAETAELGLENVVKFHGQKTFYESLRIMASANMLLLIDAHAHDSVFLPSKLTDYLTLGKPILALTPENGASSDILRRSHHYIVSPTDKEAIKTAVSEAIHNHKRGQHTLGAETASDNTFDMSELTLKFLEAIKFAQAQCQTQ